MASCVKNELDHLWHPSSFVTSHDDFMDYTKRPKYEVKAGYICLVKGSNGCAHDKSYHCSFVTHTKRRELYEGEYSTFNHVQKPVDVNLHNDLQLKDGDWLILFFIDSDGLIQHASNGEWVDFSDLFGNPISLKKGTWTRSLPRLVKVSIDSGIFHSSREENADIADWNILKKQVVLYDAMEMLVHSKYFDQT